MDPKYILDIDELDSQHQEIETIFLSLQDALEDKLRWNKLIETLYEKLKFHFYAEESIMQIFAYPEIQEHKNAHHKMLKTVESYKEIDLSDLEVEKLKEQQLIQLFFEQILYQDMRFAEFFKRNKGRLGIQ